MSQGLGDAIFGFTDAQYRYPEFKNDLEAALQSYFGKNSVTRSKKAFDVHANTYRVDADVVPCFEHRRFMGTPQSNWTVYGTELLPDNGGVIINWPRQNYRNGVEKNDATGRRFKAVIRILKRLRNEMAENGHTVADPIPSYLLECLVWNVPNEGFGHAEYWADVRYALAHFPANGRRDVVLVGSTGSITPVPGAGIYGASKRGLRAAFETLRLELAPCGVNASLVMPGMFETEALTMQGVVFSGEVPMPDMPMFVPGSGPGSPSALADTIAFMIGLPEGLCINELVARPTGQLHP